MSKSKAIILLICFLIVGMMLPVITVTVVPPWRIQVTNEDGEPLKNEPIRQTWNDYSLEFSPVSAHEEDSTTDLNGYVEFPERTIRISLLSFIYGRLRDAMPQLNPHSSYGKSSFVLCLRSGGCRAFWRESESLPDRIIVNK